MSVLLGNGNGTFQAQQTFATGSRPVSVAVADVNGDGKPDLVVANYKQQHGERAAGQRQRHLPGPADLRHRFCAGFGGGGATSTATASPTSSSPTVGSNTVSVLLGNGNGTFQAQQTFAAGSMPDSVAVGDVNGDGKPDLVVANVSAALA